MYAGTTFRNKSGHIIGVHQKVDRIALRHFRAVVGESTAFPDLKSILHFEGNNGPDGVKRKSPSVDEPWHFVDPSNPDDNGIYGLINDHIVNLANALKNNDMTRSAFEAAWMSHAIVDGLTPAHHYPLAEKIEELWGKPHTERISKIDKSFIRTGNKRKNIAYNWEYWGAKGVFTTHYLFEHGVGTAVKLFHFKDAVLTQALQDDVRKRGFEAVYRDAVNRVYALDMYHTFWVKGWTTKLAKQARHQLMPEIIRMVTLGWWWAYEESKKSSAL